MLDHLLMSLIGQKPEAAKQVIQGELDRLREGGYLDAEQVERLGAQAFEALQAGVAEAQAHARPVSDGVAAAFRDWLQVPSRDEVEAMLRESRGAGGE